MTNDQVPMTKQAPILEASMTETGAIAASVIGPSNLFGHWLLVLGRSSQDMGGAFGSRHGWRLGVVLS
jgi:hypothetical protein